MTSSGLKASDSIAGVLRRHLPVLIGTALMAIFSGAMVVVLDDPAYLRRFDASLVEQISACILLGLAAVLVFSAAMMLRGRHWAAILLAGYFAVCLMLVIPTIRHHPHTLAYALGVVCPLCGLLLLNTERHREMRQQLSERRAQRHRASPAHLTGEEPKAK
ncbi:hypothetical protein [Pseudomonas sp.]|uniref:hypothetical protein n=1 Tax=Pseudomonas sp. TaxID=306 RepID=UPI0026086130|nr:hypothetical protein [Pseudomonas sp.]